MTREELQTMLQEKETLKVQTEGVYAQLVGQIALLRDMIRKEEGTPKKTE